MKIDVNIDKSQVIPKQELEDKVLSLAKISSVYASSYDGINLGLRNLENAPAIGIQISTIDNFSVGIFNIADFQNLKKYFGISKSEELLNQSVVSVYDNNVLSGIIPITYLSDRNK